MRARAEAGFTLIEALVALVILSLAVVTALETASRTLATQAAAARHLEAVALADARLDELAALPADELGGRLGSETGNTELDSRNYRWRSVLEQSETAPELWLAAVRVEWEDGEFDVQTVLYRPTRADRSGARP